MCSVFLPCNFPNVPKANAFKYEVPRVSQFVPLIPINKITQTPALTAHVFEATFEIEHKGASTAFRFVCVAGGGHSDSLKIEFGRNKSETIRIDLMESRFSHLSSLKPSMHRLVTVLNGMCLVGKHLKDERVKIHEPTTGWIETLIRD